jgi:hypothetical protein
MNRRWSDPLAFIAAAVPIGGIGIALALAACSAAPDEEVAASSTTQALDTTCTTPFTAEQQVCSVAPDGQTTCVDSCLAVTLPAAVDASAGPGLYPHATTTPPPSGLAQLAGLNCTYGIIQSSPKSSIWACQWSSTDGGLPPALSDPWCENTNLFCVYAGSHISANPFLGDPLPGWILVEQSLSVWQGGGGGGCNNGCAKVTP